MLTIRQEHSPLIEINVSSRIRAVTMALQRMTSISSALGMNLGVTGEWTLGHSNLKPIAALAARVN
jgi:hypothetical protein